MSAAVFFAGRRIEIEPDDDPTRAIDDETAITEFYGWLDGDTQPQQPDTGEAF